MPTKNKAASVDGRRASPLRAQRAEPAATEPQRSGCITRMKRLLTAAFVCLRCRKVFKRPAHRRVGDRYEALDFTPSCPQCQTALVRVGDAFRAPPKDDLATWERVERDISSGRAFVRDEGFGRPPLSARRQRSPKGLHSPFQLPARKRRRSAEQDAPPNGGPATPSANSGVGEGPPPVS